jgi:uncharacterized membrane protein
VLLSGRAGGTAAWRPLHASPARRRVRRRVFLTTEKIMLRKMAAIALAVSFIAMATSGLMMFFIEKPSFTIQMHPVHKLFGLLMVAAAIVHLSLNFQGLKNHLRNRRAALFGVALVIALVVLYGVALNKQLPADLARQMDDAATRAEQQE